MTMACKRDLDNVSRQTSTPHIYVRGHFVQNALFIKGSYDSKHHAVKSLTAKGDRHQGQALMRIKLGDSYCYFRNTAS